MKRNILVVLVIVLVIAAALVFLRGFSGEDSWICVDGQWVKHGNPSAAMPQAGCGGEEAVTSANFTETGNIVKNNPGFKQNALYLVYEKPGQPALNVELRFAASSTCDTNGPMASCMLISASDYGFTNGARAKVTGIRNGNVVDVLSIEHVGQS